jgi:hypothetical protein
MAFKLKRMQSARRGSEAGTPRVATREAVGPPSAGNSRLFKLSVRGRFVAAIELHTPPAVPLYPGCTFSGTIDFKSPGHSTAAARCHQVCVRHTSAGVIP